jgi:hypothetical protein
MSWHGFFDILSLLGSGQMRLSARVEEVQFQMTDVQLESLASLGDEAQVWRYRAKYGPLRPTAWRSDPESHVSCRQALPIFGKSQTRAVECVLLCPIPEWILNRNLGSLPGEGKA